jgi:hypothetical protein
MNLMSNNIKLKAIALASTLLMSSCAFGDSDVEKALKLKAGGFSEETILKLLDKKEEVKNPKISFVDSSDGWGDGNSTYGYTNLFMTATANKSDNEKNKNYLNFGIEHYQGFKDLDIYGNLHIKEYAILDNNKTAIQKVYRGNIGVFFPCFINLDGGTSSLSFVQGKTSTMKNIFTNNISTNQIKWGLLLEGSFLKDASNNYSSTRSHFIGTRLAYQYNQYFDILYGKVKGLENRVKFRFETPLGKDENVILGFEYNYQVKNTSNLTDENQDIAKAYFKLPLSFSALGKMMGF